MQTLLSVRTYMCTCTKLGLNSFCAAFSCSSFSLPYSFCYFHSPLPSNPPCLSRSPLSTPSLLSSCTQSHTEWLPVHAELPSTRPSTSGSSDFRDLQSSMEGERVRQSCGNELLDMCKLIHIRTHVHTYVHTCVHVYTQVYI